MFLVVIQGEWGGGGCGMGVHSCVQVSRTLAEHFPRWNVLPHQEAEGRNWKPYQAPPLCLHPVIHLCHPSSITFQISTTSWVPSVQTLGERFHVQAIVCLLLVPTNKLTFQLHLLETFDHHLSGIMLADGLNAEMSPGHHKDISSLPPYLLRKFCWLSTTTTEWLL